jgi:hypothetical protein
MQLRKISISLTVKKEHNFWWTEEAKTSESTTE